MTYMVSLTF